MSNSEKTGPISAILQAIRAKRDRKKGTGKDIAEREAALLADIEAFDIDAAERRARREHLANSGVGMADPTHVFPEVAPGKTSVKPIPTAVPETKPGSTGSKVVVSPKINSGLLDQLRQRAEVRQREIHTALAERTSINEAVDQALKHLFFYLHEFVQQLNIIKPEIPRIYPLIEQFELKELVWQEGFADYRTQTQSSGALVELVSFSYHLTNPIALHVERDGPAVERFRGMIFNFGLPFTCKEFKNERRYVERAEFEIRSEISVSARWRADFTKGAITLETRNLERLGNAIYTILPQAVDQALLDDFGRLVLAQPNRFRELAKRQ